MIHAILPLLLLLHACSTTTSKTPESCAEIPETEGRDDCFAQVLPDLFKTDPKKAEELTESKVSDSQIRDFIYLTVTRKVDPGSNRWCQKIKEPALADRCKVIVARPHLHRDLLSGPTGAPSAGPPPDQNPAPAKDQRNAAPMPTVPPPPGVAPPPELPGSPAL